jgi:hypothetical protein
MELCGGVRVVLFSTPISPHGTNPNACTTLQKSLKLIMQFNSNPNAKILLLRLHSLHILPHRKRLPDPALYALRCRIKSLPPPHTPILPIPLHRAPARRPSARRTHHVWNRTAAVPPPPSTPPVWRRDEERSPHDSVARAERDECVGIRACAAGWVSCVDYEAVAVVCAWG